jgi:putative protein kinase ArgK-like GTPase of G3E family
MRKLLWVGAVLAMAGCASTRGVEVGSEPSTTYAIEVTNNRSSTVTIAYTAGGDRIQLGTVGARQTERFIVASPPATSITVYATTSAGGSVGNFPVTLTAGSTQRITVR